MNLKTDLKMNMSTIDTSTKTLLSTKSSPSLNLSNKLLVTSNLTTKTVSLSLKRKTDTSSDSDEEVKKHRISVVESGEVIELKKMKVDLTQPGKLTHANEEPSGWVTQPWNIIVKLFSDIVETNEDPDCIEKPSPALGLLNMVNRCLVERLSFANVESPKVKEFQNHAELGRFSK